MPTDLNFLALCKGRERYVLLFADSCRGEALKTIGRWAGNPELSFTWYDVAVLAQRIKGPKLVAAEDLEPGDPVYFTDDNKLARWPPR